MILNNRGETIIEVLVSLAMLSLAIVGSIVVARDSLTLGQSANERTQAIKIAESQLERLKSLATTSSAGTGIFSGTDFCIRDNLTLVTTLPAAPISDCSNGFFPPSGLNVALRYSANGPDGSPSTADDDLFIVSVEWDNIRGEGRDSVVIDYRLHPISL